MPITANDLVFFGSSVMDDSMAGGGARSGAVIQTDVLNNVMPSIASADRLSGRTYMRKVWPSVTSADRAALLGATVCVDELPTDPAVGVAIWTSDASTRSQALDELKADAGGSVSTLSGNFTGGTATAGSATLTQPPYQALDGTYAATHWFRVTPLPGATLGAPAGDVIKRVVSMSGSDITFDSPIAWSGSTSVQGIDSFPNDGFPTSHRVYAAAKTAALVLSGDATVPMTKTSVALAGADAYTATAGTASTAPLNGFGVLDSPPPGVGHIGFTYTATLGRVPFVLVGDTVTLYHEEATAPATASNGGTVNVGRANVDQFAIVDSSGAELVRLLKDGPASALATANFATGVLTFVNVTGFSQPVTVRHRIVHRSTVHSIALHEVTLAHAVTRDFPAGSVLTTHVPIGDLQSGVTLQFSQQAWTRVWSDALIGNSVPTMYAGTPAVTNQGAETDRYAIVFSGAANAFDCYSERLGKIASGTTAADFSPINPATGAPLFTLAAASWAGGLLVGSVFRFNTGGASAPLLVLRSVTPSSPAGTVRATLRLHGSID